MILERRKILKILSYSLVFFCLPIKTIYAATKKIINQNLTNQQKDIMFNQGTERAFTSSLLNEKRKGTYHCANCGALLFDSTANMTVELAGHLLQKQLLEPLIQK